MSRAREEFEVWAKERFGWSDGRFEMYLGEYVNGKTFDKWKVWQASRQALVVELPRSFKDMYDQYVYDEQSIKDALDKSGIKWTE